MGASYSNITLKGANRDTVIWQLSDSGIMAFVSPTVNDVFVVFDKISENGIDGFFRLVSELSSRSHCIALGVYVDDE